MARVDILEPVKAVIIIPTYNEQENILRLIAKLRAEIKKIRNWNFEILVVDDNSPDGTAKIVDKLSRRNRKIHVLLRKKKEGLGRAYLAGMKEAFGKLRADVAVIMDADLSHQPMYLPGFLKLVEDGFDFVVGSRYILGGEIAQGWAPHRKFLSVFGNKITSVVLATGAINDWTSGYRALGKKVYQRVAPILKDKEELKGYTFNMSFAYHTVRSGFRVGQIPIKFIDRTEGKSKLGLEYLFNTPIFLFKTRLKEILRL